MNGVVLLVKEPNTYASTDHCMFTCKFLSLQGDIGMMKLPNFQTRHIEEVLASESEWDSLAGCRWACQSLDTSLVQHCVRLCFSCCF